MILQCNPPIPVVSPLGKGLAQFVIDPGVEHNLQWVVFQHDTGECWTWENQDIRAQNNLTVGRDFQPNGATPMSSHQERIEKIMMFLAGFPGKWFTSTAIANRTGVPYHAVAQIMRKNQDIFEFGGNAQKYEWRLKNRESSNQEKK